MVTVARRVVPATVARLVSATVTVGPAPLVTGANWIVTLAPETPAGKLFPVMTNVFPGCTVAGATESIRTWPTAWPANERSPRRPMDTADTAEALRSFIQHNPPSLETVLYRTRTRKPKNENKTTEQQHQR